MWKVIVLAVFIVTSTIRVQAQMPCPIMFLAGNVDRDGVKLTFMNKGKLPIQQLSVTCAGQVASADVCHTESGLFYPGMRYSISFPYRTAGRRNLEITLKVAHMAEGVTWIANPEQSCRVLSVPIKK